MRRFEHGGDIYTHPGVLDFSANINPMGMPDAAKRALVEGLDGFERYPDPASQKLTEAIAHFEHLKQEEVLACAGATDAFARVCLAAKPKRALACAPCYSGYEQACEQAGADLTWHELRHADGFRVTERFAECIDKDVDLVFIANPNNPTGLRVSEGIIRSCLMRAREAGAVVVLDECFVDLAGGGGSNALLHEFENLVIVKALTKTYALAGLRVGYALSSNKELLSAMRAAGQPWAVSVPAQLAGVASLQDEGYLAKSQELVARERERLSAALLGLGLHVLPSDASYLLFEGPEGLYERLLRRRILIRPCDNFRGLGNRWYRVAVRSFEEDEQLIGALGVLSQGWDEGERAGGEA
ncbi:MAG: aminotransferase class I/II-fold pyridoxal phosphate-dependent enzyme [Atopobiaceae bacterium]|nr:aminotransferase class I/II-fold pyridoxal phosphate-dependent enzyme [Atopobiaceae bacterium]